MEKRLLLAFVLSAVIFALWSVLFPPPKPPTPAPPVPGEAIPSPTRAAPPGDAEPPAPVRAPETEPSPVSEQVVQGEVEERVRLVNDDVAVEFTSRGAAILSFELLGYTGDEGEQLDLIQTVDHPARSLPLQIVTPDGPDERLYSVERRGSRRVAFIWADGGGNRAEKEVELAEDGFGLEVDLRTRGALLGAAVSIGTGMRDLGQAERNSRLARWGDVVILADGELEEHRRAKLKQSFVVTPQALAYAGFQDTYFLSILRPRTAVAEVRVNRVEYQEPAEEGDGELGVAAEVLLLPRGGELSGQLLGAPKEYDLLQEIGGGVEQTLDFGVFGPISVLFLKALWWIYGVVGNYGVAIILLTVAIRLLLFPLMHTSTVSMRKMQKLQPKIKEIQAKHKKKKQDQQARAKMNQEMMALYKQEGVNPMGGCLPMLVQLPILWALYKLFLNAIELRHAPFMLWIQDLSAKDPYYITPILMTATMWLQQRLAPQAGDPQQQRIMRMLPLVFGIMFLQFPSGLVLYWLTNNVLTIIQQEVTLHLVGERKRGSDKGGKR
jgi:YidC/Oxa1 family membrane protein insertase